MMTMVIGGLGRSDLLVMSRPRLTCQAWFGAVMRHLVPSQIYSQITEA